MGTLINGAWTADRTALARKDGAFVRQESAFRDWIDPAGAFPPARGRYHLFVARSCPWAHRTLVVRALKGLERAIPAHYARPVDEGNGWAFGGDGGIDYLHQLYTRANPRYSGRATVPVLWDSATGRIVNNESSEILRMLNRDFDAWARKPLADLYPVPSRREIDRVNERVYHGLNNGVYRAGFATAQAKYEQAAKEVFATLDWLERRLMGGRWLCGARFTEADVRLFTTLVRFDAVYHGHFKCNLRRLADYPRLSRYLERFLALPGVAATVALPEIKEHYYRSQRQINPSGVVPLGPRLAWKA